MPQLSLYLDESTMNYLRNQASTTSVSLSKYVGQVLKENATSAWPENYWELYGSLEDETFTEPAELDFVSDTPRHSF